jgi:pimeloyl-ACP methyl ester carboxylesterase
MKPKKTIITALLQGARLGRLCPVLLAGVVTLVLSASVHAAGDGLVIRLRGAELQSKSPREAGKVPVVFVHGLLGSPANWSQLIDQLNADPSARERFQFLTFGYNSLQPIPESGRQLFDALAAVRRRFDPEGRDASFDRIVLVGCSLGGLIAKAAATCDPSPLSVRGSRMLVHGQEQPVMTHVGRIIFVVTPHRGASIDRDAVRSVGAGLARLLSPSIAKRGAGGDADARGTPTSVDQLACDHPILRDLERARAATGVPCHSIIATLGEPSAEWATDGLVPVASARLQGARSEVVIRTLHFCLQHPEVIREIHRILGEHAGSHLTTAIYQGQLAQNRLEAGRDK